MGNILMKAKNEGEIVAMDSYRTLRNVRRLDGCKLDNLSIIAEIESEQDVELMITYLTIVKKCFGKIVK
jgi:uncharacterized metal-binding protein